MIAMKNGGPAFPSIAGHNAFGQAVYANGMSLRDAMAIGALPVAITVIWRDIGYTPQDGLSDMQQHARLAYQMADAMLVERAK